MKNRPVPVFMYHTVGIPNIKWKWNNLTIPYQKFEKQLLFLKKNNYHTIHLNELYESIHSNKTLPKKTIILTFDDGYVDNYIFAYPLLKKYGFKGTIFINPEFVDSRTIVRKKLDETKDTNELETLGFLSWDEMKIMEKDNTVDIQSHAMTHTWYPVSNEIVDFRHPNDDYWWMTWNSNKKQKPFLQIDNSELVNYGEPVYKYEKSLLARRYFPNIDLNAHIIDLVKNKGGTSFFQNEQWKDYLLDEWNKCIKKEDVVIGYYESEKENTHRITIELKESKKIIEDKLNKKIEYLCWPGGSGTIKGIQIADEVGYKMSTVARDIPGNIRSKIKNNGELFPKRIGRLSPVLYSNKKGEIVYADSFGLFLRYNAFKTDGFLQKIIKATILFYGKIINLLH
jgi:hypothetical protein